MGLTTSGFDLNKLSTTQGCSKFICNYETRLKYCTKAECSQQISSSKNSGTLKYFLSSVLAAFAVLSQEPPKDKIKLPNAKPKNNLTKLNLIPPGAKQLHSPYSNITTLEVPLGKLITAMVWKHHQHSLAQYSSRATDLTPNCSLLSAVVLSLMTSKHSIATRAATS